MAVCARTPGPEDAPGTCVLHLRDASGGEFIHRYALDDAPTEVSRGGWAYEWLVNRPNVTFHGFPYRGPGSHAFDPSRRGIWPASIRRTRTGTVALPVDGNAALRDHRISTRMLGSGAARGGAPPGLIGSPDGGDGE